jgi:hypothetical protein
MSNDFDRVICQDDIPVSSESHPVESFVGVALVAVCIRHKTPLALLIREDNPLYVDPAREGDMTRINLTLRDYQLAYLFTERQLSHELMRISIEKAIFVEREDLKKKESSAEA